METNSVDSQLASFVANNASAVEPSVEKDLADYVRGEKYGSTSQQIISGLEGAASAATFGLSTGIETNILGVPAEDIQARREENPISHGVGQLAGIVGTSAIPGVGAGKILTGAGETLAAGLGLAQEATTLTKIGSQAAKMAAENMLFQAGDEVSKMFTDTAPPGEAAQTALVNIGLSGILGAGMGGAFGAANPLWNATAGPKVEKILNGLKNKIDGLGGKMPEELATAIQESGLGITPEVQAFLSGSPIAKHTGQTLEQSATESGLKFQRQLADLNIETADKAVEALGTSPEFINRLKNLSDYETGANVVDRLHTSIKSKAEPVIEEFQRIRKEFSKTPLTQESDILADRLANLAESEFGSYRLGDDYQFIQKQLSNLPNIRDLEGLRQVQSGLWNEAKTGKASWEAVGKVVGIMRDVEGDTIMRAAREKGEAAIANLAKENAPLVEAAGKEGKKLLAAEKRNITKSSIASAEDEVMRVQMARSAYGDLANEITELNKYLKLKKFQGPESFLKALSEAGEESILKKVTKEDSVRMVEFLKNRFPEAAQDIRDYQINTLLKDAGRQAKGDEVISVKKLFRDIDDMSPEMRENLIGPDQMKRLEALRTVKEALPDRPMNTSGTAKTLDALWGNVPGTAMGALAFLSGSNPIMATLIGGLSNALSRDIPDATRMALLKYIGTGGNIEAGAFKTMVDYIAAAAKGEARLSKAIGSVFKPGAEVISSKLIPNEKDRQKLDKRVMALRDNPNDLISIGGNAGAYIPNQASGVAATASNAISVLANLKPDNPKRSPLDANFPPTKAQEYKYNRALDLAEQPLMILEDVKKGTINHEEMSFLKSIYPDLVTRMQSKLMNDLNTSLAKGENIPYNTRMGLSLFLETPLDSTMTPESINAIQQQNAVAPAAQQPQTMPKKSMKGLEKMPGQFQTVDQARVARKLKTS